MKHYFFLNITKFEGLRSEKRRPLYFSDSGIEGLGDNPIDRLDCFID
jgi:hypothetical protein